MRRQRQRRIDPPEKKNCSAALSTKLSFVLFAVEWNRKHANPVFQSGGRERGEKNPCLLSIQQPFLFPLRTVYIDCFEPAEGRPGKNRMRASTPPLLLLSPVRTQPNHFGVRWRRAKKGQRGSKSDYADFRAILFFLIQHPYSESTHLLTLPSNQGKHRLHNTTQEVINQTVGQ